MNATVFVASRYDRLFCEASRIAARRREMRDMVQQMFDSFSASFVGLIDEFDQFFDTTDDSAPRPSAVARYTDWAAHFIANNQVSRAFYQDLIALRSGAAAALGTEYAAAVERIVAQFRSERERLDVETERYCTQYSVYTDLCERIESVGAQLTRRETSASKQETLQRDLDKLRGECVLVEGRTAAASDSYRCAILAFQCAADQLLVEFEEWERRFFGDAQDVIYQFVSIAEKLSESYRVLAEAAESNLVELEEQATAPRRASDAPRKVSVIVDEFSQIPVLQFDVFKLMPWDVVFYGELHATFGRMTSSYTVENSYLELEENEIVKVVKETGSYVLIESDRTGLRGRVPPGIVKPVKGYKRKVYQINDDFMDSETVVAKGQFVIGLMGNDTTTKCKTAGGVYVSIPNSMLVEAKKSK